MSLTPGVVGYLDRLYASPGDEIVVRVSVLDGTGRYRAELVRLISGETGPGGPGLKEETIPTDLAGEHEGSTQPVPIGSYAIVENIPPLQPVEFSLLVWPTLPGRGTQALMAIGPVRLVLDDAGAAALTVEDETISTGVPLRRRAWYAVEGRYDPATGSASVRSEPLPGIHAHRVAQKRGHLRSGVIATGSLLIAAAPHADGVRQHFNGKIEAPTLRSIGLAAEWDFSRGIGTARIEDKSRHGLHGRTVNAPKRAVTGARWDGSVHDWRQDPSHYGAIHFHEDDLADAGWQPSLRFRLPDALKSGYYAVKLTASG
ncbi:MAG: N,N-dimethylformamidase beta subunit family domain-containing protein, partial [Stellaceae bacterium]